MKQFSKIIKSNWILIVILLLATFLRLYRIADFMEFLGDQGRDVVIVRDLLVNGNLIFIGPQTSIGNMYLGPWYYYLMAPFLLLFNFNPVGPATMVALLGIATVWLVYKIAKEWFNKTIAIIAAILTTCSPVLIYYSIFSWNPNIMPFFSLLSVWLTWRIYHNNEFKKLLWLALSLVMVLNSHYLGLLLFPPVGLFLFLSLYKSLKSKTSKRLLITHYSLFTFIFLLMMTPLILFDLKHNFMNYNAFYKFFTDRQITVNFKWYKGITDLPVIFNQLFTNFIQKQDKNIYLNLSIPLLLIGLGIYHKKKEFWFLISFLVIGVLGLANYKQHVYAHYFLFLYPLLAIFIASMLVKLKWFGYGIVALILFVMIRNWHGIKTPNYQLARSQETARFIINQSTNQDFALALIAEQNYDPPYRYFLYIDKARLVTLHEKMPNQLFVICEPWGKVNCNPVNHPLWDIAAFGWAKIDQQWDLNGIKIFKLIHNVNGNI